MCKFLIFFFILILNTAVNASTKEMIILKLEKTNNLSFNFKQTIEKKNEEGNCVIRYPKKIYCQYKNLNEKIIVSDGKSLVIKNKNNKNFYIYPLDKTILGILLDKNYLLEKIRNLKSQDIDGKYLGFKIVENNNEINIFFDKKTLNLIGWQTEDIYQNLNITFISSVSINQKIDENIFILPKRE